MTSFFRLEESELEDSDDTKTTTTLPNGVAAQFIGSKKTTTNKSSLQLNVIFSLTTKK